MKKCIFYILTFFLVYIFFEGVCLLGLYLLAKGKDVRYKPISAESLSSDQRNILQRLLERKTRYSDFDPVLGWRIKPNGATWLYRANAQGIRADKEYGKAPAPGITRILSFGDSFTHGDNVKNNETWERRLEEQAPTLEVLNFGVPGYGLDQAFLYYQKVSGDYSASIVLIGYLSDDIYRHVNVFRPFYNPYTQYPMTKPRFLFQNGRYIYLKNPFSELEDYKKLLSDEKTVLAKLGQYDDYYNSQNYIGPFDFLPSVRLYKIKRYEQRAAFLFKNAVEARGYYNPKAEAFKVTAYLFEQFYDTVQRNKAKPIIVVFPDGRDVIRYKKTRTKRYAPLLKFFQEHNMTYIDVMNAFFENEQIETTGKELFVDYHYSPLANKIVADYIAKFLDKHAEEARNLLFKEHK